MDLESSTDSLASLISAVTLGDSAASPFRFFDLPFELRVKILTCALVTPKPQSLDPDNYRDAARRMNIFLASRKLWAESYRVYYGGHTFRIFPTHGRFFGNKILPLPARLSPRCRGLLVALELRLGPGWNKPPLSWRVDERLGLNQMTSVRVLRIYIECDPSLEYFKGFRMETPSYTDFCSSLLGDILDGLPGLTRVEIDGSSSVKAGGTLLVTLVDLVVSKGNIAVIVLGEMMKSRNSLGHQGIRSIVPRCSSHQLPPILSPVRLETAVE